MVVKAKALNLLRGPIGSLAVLFNMVTIPLKDIETLSVFYGQQRVLTPWGLGSLLCFFGLHCSLLWYFGRVAYTSACKADKTGSIPVSTYLQITNIKCSTRINSN